MKKIIYLLLFLYIVFCDVIHYLFFQKKVTDPILWIGLIHFFVEFQIFIHF
jgi:hypothetical protein